MAKKKDIATLLKGRKLEDLPRTQRQAQKMGEKYFWPQRPCKNDHNMPHLASSGKCMECHRLDQNKRYAEQPELAIARVQARTARRKAEEPEALRAEWRRNERAWRAANPERTREQSREWRKANPEKAAACDHNDRARRKGAEGTHTAEDIRLIREKQGDCCAHPWCKKKLKGKGHKDHIIALKNGGTNYAWNMQLLCAPCNLKKHAKDHIKFAQENGYLF